MTIRLILLCFLTGCSTPQMRVFQKAVPEPVGKPAELIEAERYAAKVIAVRIESPPELIPVAQELSNSLGEPNQEVDDDLTPYLAESALDSIYEGQVEYQEDRDKQDKWLRKYHGLEIEGTGVNLFGGTVFLSFAAIIAACILLPGFGSLVIFLVRRLRVGMAQMVEGVEQWKAEHPDQAGALEEKLSRATDKAHKKFVKRLKKHPSGASKTNLDEIKKRKFPNE